MGYIGHGADLTAPGVAALDLGQAVAFLPNGAVDQHGPDLPLSVDRDLAAHPALVRMDRARDFGLAHLDWQGARANLGLGPAPLRPGWLMGDPNPEGAVGNAAAATADKGAALLGNAARNLSRLAAAFARFGQATCRPKPSKPCTIPEPDPNHTPI